MKKIKTIVFSVAVVCVSLFLCSAGCQNAADSGGGSSGGGSSGMTKTEEAIAAIKNLTANSPVLTVKLTSEATVTVSGVGTYTVLSHDLGEAISNAPDGKINLDLSQTQITDFGYDNGDGVTRTFMYCTSLRSVNLPNSVMGIESAFEGCTSLTSVTIPSNVTSIDRRAFYDCTSLTSVTIPSNVTSIDLSAFHGCTSLTSVTIPDSVTKIKNAAFVMCTSLASVTIPSRVTQIQGSAFEGCTSLTSVYVKATTPPSLGNYVFDSTSTNLKIYVPSGSVEEYKSNSQTVNGIEVGWKRYTDKIVAK